MSGMLSLNVHAQKRKYDEHIARNPKKYSRFIKKLLSVEHHLPA
jgi:hypothetical protein